MSLDLENAMAVPVAERKGPVVLDRPRIEGTFFCVDPQTGKVEDIFGKASYRPMLRRRLVADYVMNKPENFMALAAILEASPIPEE